MPPLPQLGYARRMSVFTRKQLLQMVAAAAGSTALASVGCGDEEPTGTANSEGGDGSGATANAGGSGASSNDGGSGNTGNAGGTGGVPGTGGNTSGGGSGDAGACAGMGVLVAAISNPHGHTLSIPESDVAAGVNRTYTTTGSATHSHQVTLTAADFAALRNGDVVKVFTCDGGDHQYVFSCSANPPPPEFPVPGC